MNATKDVLNQFLEPTRLLNYQHSAVQDYVREFAELESEIEKATGLYLKVRDGFLYDPYHLDLRPESLTASAILENKRAWCVEKAIVCCAGLRALGIPSRLGYGIVRNHVGVEKLVHYLRKDEIVFHGYVEAFLDGNWVKCTPAFDRRICRVSGVEPLNWNGKDDSLFQAFRGDQKFMEYIHFYGAFTDVPLLLMHREMHLHYPHLFTNPIDTSSFSFKFDPNLLTEASNELNCEIPVTSGSSST